MAQRVRLSRAKGFRLQDSHPGAVVVARPGPWGNPFRVADMCWLAVGMGFCADLPGRTAAAVELYRRWLGLEHRDGPVAAGPLDVRGLAFNVQALVFGDTIKAPAAPSVDHIRAELRGKPLACWCRLDAPCHADVLLEIANG